MSAFNKYLFSALLISNCCTTLNGMETLAHLAFKKDPTYLKSHLNQDKTCETLIAQGQTIPSERSLDEKTCEFLEKFINRKRDAHRIIFDYLKEGQIKEAEEFSASIPFHLLQPLVRLYAVRHIEKFKKAEQEKAEQLLTLIHPSSNAKPILNDRKGSFSESPSALGLRASRNDKTGLWHYYNKWYNLDYRLDHLGDTKTISLCAALKEQAIKPPTAPALDEDTHTLLLQFSERCLLASKTVVALLKKSDELSLNKLKDLYARLIQKKDDIHDIFCPVIQLFALRGLIQYQKSIAQVVKKIDNNVMLEEPLTKLPAYPTSNYLDAQSLCNVLAERETEYNSMRDALLEKMNPQKRSPDRSPAITPIRKNSAPTEASTPLPVPTPQNTSPAKNAASPLPVPNFPLPDLPCELPTNTVETPAAPITAMPIMPTPQAPRKPSPKTMEQLAGSVTGALPTPTETPTEITEIKAAHRLSFPPSTSVPSSTSPLAIAIDLGTSVPESIAPSKSLIHRKKGTEELTKRLQSLGMGTGKKA